MFLLDPDNYTLSLELFYRLLGFIYFFAFGAFLFQIRGLIGQQGILPISNLLTFSHHRVGKKAYYYIPSLFWWWNSDTALMTVTAIGTALSVLLMLNVYPAILLPLLFILYLSIVSVGQDFLSFGWEGFCLETTFHAIFLSLTSTPNLFVWISLNFLIFRFHFHAAASKLQSGDRTWRTLTALCYHYETQPIPNALAWYAHKLPIWFHKFSTVLMLFIQLVIPFLVFGNETMRLIAFCFFFLLQFSIWATGNYSYLNHLTVVMCIPLIGNSFLEPFLGPAPPLYPTPNWLNIPISLVGLTLIFLQAIRFWHHFYRNNQTIYRILMAVQPFHLANRGGIFAIMTTERYEIVIEGSNDKVDWKEYLFWHKPSELNRRPRRVAPYQPRIDWQAWFLPFSTFREESWIQNMLVRLLEGSPQVLKLLRYNPFPDAPPKYLRIQLYLYKFTDFKTKKETGNWWQRTYIQEYSPVLMRKS